MSGVFCAYYGADVVAPGNKIMAAIFSLNAQNRNPLAYILGSETMPMAFATALANFQAISGGKGYFLPMGPITLQPGWYAIAIFIDPINLSTPGNSVGTPICIHHQYPQGTATNVLMATSTYTTNLDFLGTMPGSVVAGALSSLNISDPTLYADAAALRQAHIAWYLACDFLG